LKTCAKFTRGEANLEVVLGVSFEMVEIPREGG